MHFFKSFIRFVRLLLWIIVIISVVVFSAANREAVTVSLFPFPWEMTLPLFLILILATGLGFLIGSANARIDHLHDWLDKRRQRQKIESLEEANASLEAESKSHQRAIAANEAANGSSLPSQNA